MISFLLNVIKHKLYLFKEIFKFCLKRDKLPILKKKNKLRLFFIFISIFKYLYIVYIFIILLLKLSLEKTYFLIETDCMYTWLQHYLWDNFLYVYRLILISILKLHLLNTTKTFHKILHIIFHITWAQCYIYFNIIIHWRGILKYCYYCSDI